MIVSDTLARRLFSGEDPIGRQILAGRGAWRTVIGVAAKDIDAALQQVQQTGQPVAGAFDDSFVT